MKKQPNRKRTISEVYNDALSAFRRHRRMIIFFAATHVVFLILGQWMIANEMPGAVFIRAEEMKILKESGLLQSGTGSFYDGLLLRVGAAFFLNVVFSAFLYSTVSGVFFFVPYVVAVWRSFLMGVLIYGHMDWSMKSVAIYLTILLEFCAYSLSSTAGTDLGLTLLWPERKNGQARGPALRESLKDASDIYFFVIILLFVSTIFEIAAEGYFGPFLSL